MPLLAGVFVARVQHLAQERDSLAVIGGFYNIRQHRSIKERCIGQPGGAKRQLKRREPTSDDLRSIATTYSEASAGKRHRYGKHRRAFETLYEPSRPLPSCTTVGTLGALMRPDRHAKYSGNLCTRTAYDDRLCNCATHMFSRGCKNGGLVAHRCTHRLRQGY